MAKPREAQGYEEGCSSSEENRPEEGTEATSIYKGSLSGFRSKYATSMDRICGVPEADA